MSSNWIYGVLDSNGCHIDIGLTERGAKVKATKDGYRQISRRHIHSWAVEIVATKRNGKWTKED